MAAILLTISNKNFSYFELQLKIFNVFNVYN